MKQRTVRAIAIIIAIAMVLTSLAFVLFIPSVYGATAQDTAKMEQRMQSLEEYLLYIEENYKDQVSLDDLVNGAFAGALTSLNDPYSVYFEESAGASSFQNQINNNYEGVGVTIQKSGNQCLVTDIHTGGPAAKAGIQVGDYLTFIDGKSLDNKALEDIAVLLRGPAGSTVKITVLRSGMSYDITVTREKIQNQAVAYQLMGEDIGYIKISSFDSDSDQEFNKARIALVNQGAEKLILDLRGNGGGLINTAINIADYFVEEGAITHFYRQDKLVETHNATKAHIPPLPTVVLIDNNSASATELLAAAVKDHKGATLVGKTTYGKGVAQMVGTLPYEGSFKLSVFYFVSPLKNDIHGKGVEPDYWVDNQIASDLVKAKASYEGFVPMKEKVKPSAGMTGLNVYGAQQRLQLLGYPVQPTAVMDPETVKAVTDFQRNMGLWPYGVLDYTTMVQLDTQSYNYSHGVVTEDYQLEKARELLKDN
ncbi:MAG: PDZ domain-containing protein [Alphaproteobacteria bacterium]|nr:PDZ domain-containing protein [Alphaproteobacteria bacterium]